MHGQQNIKKKQTNESGSRGVREEYINTARTEKERTERRYRSSNKLSEMYS